MCRRLQMDKLTGPTIQLGALATVPMVVALKNVVIGDIGFCKLEMTSWVW